MNESTPMVCCGNSCNKGSEKGKMKTNRTHDRQYSMNNDVDNDIKHDSSMNDIKHDVDNDSEQTNSTQHDTTNNDILSEDIADMKQNIISKKRTYRYDILHSLVDPNNAQQLIETEMRILLKMCMNASNKDKEFTLPLHSDYNDGKYENALSLTNINNSSVDTLHDNDVITITDINSKSQIIHFVNIAAHYNTVYMIKSKLLNPIDKTVHVLLIGKKEETKSSKFIHNLSNIIDFGLIMHGLMNYYVKLEWCMSDANELKVNDVKMNHIQLSYEKECELYRNEVKDYVKMVKKWL